MPNNVRRVLLIEDSPEYSTLILSWLGQAPELQCVHADDGVTGEAFARSGDWDLVICDLELPGMSGVDLLPLIKQYTPWTQVMVVTAHARMDYALHAVRHADAMLLKPVVYQEFQQNLGRLLDEASKRKHQSKKCVLAIGAHPDDVEIGCGGTLARYAAENAQVVILVLSGGEAGGTASKRRLESELAAQAIGAILHLEDLPDRSISPGHPTVGRIEHILKQYPITHIYTHSSHDSHQDHRAANAAAIVACRAVPNLFCYQSPSTTVDFRPNLFCGVQAHFDAKLAAIAHHASQTTTRPYLAPELIRATALYWGRFCGYGLAEPFEAIRVTQ